MNPSHLRAILGLVFVLAAWLGALALAATAQDPPSHAVVSESRAVVEPGAPDNSATAISGFSGLAWAGRLLANGKRAVIVLIPVGTDLSRPIEVMVWFHGVGGNAARGTQWLRPYIERLPEYGRNAIVVLPSSGNFGTIDANWMSPRAGESLIGLQDQAVAVATTISGQELQVGRYLVCGFSGGGLPVATAAWAGQLRAHHVNLFDATFGSWGDLVVRHRRAGTTINIFYTEQNRQRAERLRGKPGVHVEASITDHGGTATEYFYR